MIYVILIVFDAKNSVLLAIPLLEYMINQSVILRELLELCQGLLKDFTRHHKVRQRTWEIIQLKD
jgi:hypothetical protein